MLIQDDRKMEQLHVIEKLGVDGTYQFCMDNSFSILSDKTVYLDVLIYDPEEERSTEETPTTDKDIMIAELDIKLSDMLVRCGVYVSYYY